MEFKVGNAVVHMAEGVCRIEAIAEKTFDGRTDEYYVLRSVYNDRSTVYIPVETVKNRPKIRPVLLKEEIDGIIRVLPEASAVSAENDNARRQLFKEILCSGDNGGVARVLKTIYGLKTKPVASGKKMRVSDERIVRETEQLLFSEFAYSLGITPEEIPAYIEEHIGKTA
ncbi:MAG: hypothetical protein NC084_10135 [Bacteroides sp.]|nr:hypothetical protein [Eubacterium sp.]MCM1419161.1 hypothetical protein [Roseburia sp.]MCM1463058.1 hypothetical protein [Bacteroides sp.]